MTAGLAVRTIALSKQYHSITALRECTIEVPLGGISALIGPNGAGKTTLLQILAGLLRPTAGEAFVLGRAPAQEPTFLAEIGFLAQEVPMYSRLSAEDHICLGAHLNTRWDGGAARNRIASLDIPLTQKVGTLSGGQRAQVALALALAKRPRLLLLDEPVAALDPFARRQFLALLAEAVADGDLTVLLSSHLVNDLERICDHLVLLSGGRTQLCGPIEEIISEHKLLVGSRRDPGAIERDHTVVQRESTPRQTTLLVRTSGPIVDPNWEAHDISLEELVIAYMARSADEAHRKTPAIAAAR